MTSCSIFSSGGSRSIEFSSVDSPSSSIRLLSSSPYLYEIPSTDEKGGDPLYATAVEECKNSTPKSPESLARQLFVGLGDLKIIKQEKKTIGTSPLLFSILTATLDNKPVTIAAYTGVNGHCVRDFVVWSPDSTDPHENQGNSAHNVENSFGENLARLAPLVNDVFNRPEGAS